MNFKLIENIYVKVYIYIDVFKFYNIYIYGNFKFIMLERRVKF